jgi:hypothetical protein
MAHAAFHVPQHQSESAEHPVGAVVAVIAILAAIVLIVWARVELHGVDDLQAALVSPILGEAVGGASRLDPRYEEEREREAAVVSNRWATGLHN